VAEFKSIFSPSDRHAHGECSVCYLLHIKNIAIKKCSPEDAWHHQLKVKGIRYVLQLYSH